MLLSVIVPVYKTQSTLDACMESVASQIGGRGEIVMVDDGSPDASAAMCDQWAMRDKRVRVVHKANGGLSEARNAGIDASRGDMLMFVDSDDTIAPDTIAPLVDIMTGNPQVDILEFPVTKVWEGRREDFLSFQSPLAVYDDMRDYWLGCKAYCHTFACNKIYRRRLFAAEAVRFPVGRVFEDAYTLPRLLSRARRVATTGRGEYRYVQNPLGITATAGARELAMLLDAHIDVLGRLLNEAAPTARIDGALRDYYIHVVDIQLSLSELTGEKPSIPSRLVTLSHLSAVHKVKALMVNTLGLSALCRANRLMRILFPRKRR